MYTKLIRLLMYLVNIRPNFLFTINTLSQFMVGPKRVHLEAARHILRYVLGTVEYGLKYTLEDDIRLNGFTDADWVGNSVDRKGTLEYSFSVGSGMIYWCNKKHNSLALSLAEAKYMSTYIITCKVIWLRKLHVSFFRKWMEVTSIFYDNQSCIKISKNIVFHDQSKYINDICHFIRDCVQCGAVRLWYVSTGNKVADILIKSLGKAMFI